MRTCYVVRQHHDCVKCVVAYVQTQQSIGREEAVYGPTDGGFTELQLIEYT